MCCEEIRVLLLTGINKNVGFVPTHHAKSDTSKNKKSNPIGLLSFVGVDGLATAQTKVGSA